MADDKIEIKVGVNASSIGPEMRKAADEVGKATTGMARGVSAAIGNSLGPWGELIEKADTFKKALGGLSPVAQVAAGAMVALSAAAVYGIKKMVDAWGEAKSAMEDYQRSYDARVANAQKVGASILREGIAAGTEETAKKAILSNYADMSPEAKKEADKALESIRTGEAVKKGETRLAQANLTPETRKAIEAEQFKQYAEQFGTERLPQLKQEREDLAKNLLSFRAMNTQQGAESANRAAKSIENLDKLIPLLESRRKDELDTQSMAKEWADLMDQNLRDIFGDEPSAAAAKAISGGSSGVPLGYGVGGFTSIGGGGNIYGMTPGKNTDQQLLNAAERTARATEAIATNGAVILP